MKKNILLILILLALTNIYHAQSDSISNQILSSVSSKNAEVGVAVYNLKSGESFGINQDKHFPMQSVYKFHIALAVLHQVDEGKFTLDEKILIKKSDLLENTWSPLRKKYPEGNVEIPLSEIVNFTVSLSDNNGCDILIRLLGGTEIIQNFIDSIGINDFSITSTEEEMHKEWSVQFSNWTTPRSSTNLLKKFYNREILSENTHDFLWKIMTETKTGGKRLKEQLPESVLIAHKTGTSSTNSKGITAAVNDIGIIKLNNEKAYAISIYVSNTTENMQTNEKIISNISKIVFEYFKNN